VLLSGLDIARSANLELEHWQACLDLLGEIELVKRGLGTGEHDLARTRSKRYGPLMMLGKLAEAKAVLEDCLDVFHRMEAVADEAVALSSLASVWNALDDSAQAVALERRALVVHEHLPDPLVRLISHNNLVTYLEKASLADGAKTHRLAALVYGLITGLHQRVLLGNLAAAIRESEACGEPFAFPRLADLLAAPAFVSLGAFVAERGVSVDQLQAEIDSLVEQIRAAVAAEPA
jgi:hypothetical protein